MTILSEHTATATVGALVLKVINGNATLDYDRAPYAQLTITCALPSITDLALIDPRDGVRVTVVLTQTFGTWNSFGYRDPESRAFDVGLVSRDIDENAATVTLTLWSDEAALLNFALVASGTERTYGLSAKTAVAYALAKIGATLAAGAADGNVVSKALEPNVVNLFTNPRGASNATGISVGGGTLTRPTSGGPIANMASFFRLTMTSTTTPNLFNPDNFTPVATGKTYTAVAWVRSSAALSTNFDYVLFNGASVVLDGANQLVVLAANTWTRVTYTFTTSGTVTGVSLRFLGATTLTSGQTFDATGFLIVEGSTAPESFDGSSTDPGLYSFSWVGTAHASKSTKTNLPNADVMIWQPGTTAWDFLTPILQATNLRLYCDETRSWILEASGTLKDGLVSVGAAQNATEARDTISLVDEEDGLPIWYTGVVVKYSWTDAIGLPQVAYDTAGTGDIVLSLEYPRPYPGAGAAVNILARAAGRGRVFDLEAMSSYPARPGMALIASIPHAPLQSGVVSAITWQFPAARMRVRSRALIDTPAGAYLLAPPTRSYATTPAGYTYLTYVN